MFKFGDEYRGRYDKSVKVAEGFYTSYTGYKDELLWAALWLYRATGNEYNYLLYAIENAASFGGTTWPINEFSWDVKLAGVQILASTVRTVIEPTYLSTTLI